MPSLQIRDMPDSTYELLKERAKKDNRSISQEALTLIQICLCYSGDSSFHNIDRHYSYVPRDPERERREAELAEKAEREARLEKRRALFDRIRNSEPIPVTPETPDTVQIIHKMREERESW